MTYDPQANLREGRALQIAPKDSRPNRKFTESACCSSEKAQARFWKKVNKDGPIVRPELGPCWLWTGRTSPKGYGQFNHLRRDVEAHRVSCRLAYGAIPDGMLACHHCDNPSCVNPAHLFIGTHKQNSGDMVRRSRCGAAELHARGEQNGLARLTESAVLELRAMKAAGTIPNYCACGRRYGVSATTVRYAVLGRTWTHL